MSKEILIDTNRTLKLKNVLEYTIDLSKMTEQDNLNLIIKRFDDFIKNNNLISFGPVIFQTILIGGDSPKALLKVMRQLREKYEHAIVPYQFKESIATGVCLYAHFEGDEKDSNYAQSKLQVYAYENDLVLDTTSYQVYISRKDTNVVVDSFIPILGSAL